MGLEPYPPPPPPQRLSSPPFSAVPVMPLYELKHEAALNSNAGEVNDAT